MKDHEVKALFKSTLEDWQLSRSERGDIRDLLDIIKGNEQKRALFRSMAFAEAREALGRYFVVQQKQRLLRATCSFICCTASRCCWASWCYSAGRA